MKIREAKTKGEKERYTHLNPEFQRIARRNKKAFLSDQCKVIEVYFRFIHKKLHGRKKSLSGRKMRYTDCVFREKQQNGISSRISEIPKEHFMQR